MCACLLCLHFLAPPLKSPQPVPRHCLVEQEAGMALLRWVPCMSGACLLCMLAYIFLPISLGRSPGCLSNPCLLIAVGLGGGDTGRLCSWGIMLHACLQCPHELAQPSQCSVVGCEQPAPACIAGERICTGTTVVMTRVSFPCCFI